MIRIKVRLKDGREELFPYYVLDHLIKTKGIIAFERSGGWVLVDQGPVRRKPPVEPFLGTKRRLSDHLTKKRITDHPLG